MTGRLKKNRSAQTISECATCGVGERKWRRMQEKRKTEKRQETHYKQWVVTASLIFGDFV